MISFTSPIKKEDILIKGETVLKEYGSIILTDFRIIKIVNGFFSKRFQDIPYKFLNSIKYGQEINKKIFNIGITLLGLYLFCSWLSSKIPEGGLLTSAFEGVANSLNAFSLIFLILGICIIAYVLIFQSKNTSFISSNSNINALYDKELIKDVREFQKRYFENP
ncbi:MAG: PH domain-containing protein [Nanoarchaeota archaeon]|nr:PH domain-containing protein [Nanoarchaeota archaeon]